MLASFMDKMIDIASRSSVSGKALDSSDKDVFAAAMEVRKRLDGYHGRAAFDERNIEDVLSILSFDVIAGDPDGKKSFDAFVRAISRTIELTGQVSHSGRLNEAHSDPAGEIYQRLWKALFESKRQGTSFPSIVSFNYDLVLERSLFQLLVGLQYDWLNKRPPFKSFAVNYHYDHLPRQVFGLERATYHGEAQRLTGTTLQFQHHESEAEFEIELLKLHGSLNFPSKAIGKSSPSLVEATDVPYLLPPIFNKMSINKASRMWGEAIERLRGAKNLIFVGYSLPDTDIYMQYFLKAGLGPNLELDRVFVFNPVLFGEDEYAKQMEQRYLACFSSNFRNRVVLRPKVPNHFGERLGTFRHFLSLLETDPSAILF